VTDYGLPFLQSQDEKSRNDLFSKYCGDLIIIDRLWTAPELLRTEHPPINGTPAGDSYSFAIVVSEIISRDLPFGSHNKTPTGKCVCVNDEFEYRPLIEIINLVRAGIEPPFRPEVSTKVDVDMDLSMNTLMRDCWLEEPKLRPDFKHIKIAIKQMSQSRFD
jgi:atrial natriuretic peptide receptor A